MGATAEVDRWECATKPDRKLSIRALVDDHPPPVWRVTIKDGVGIRKIRVIALTEFDAIERVLKELPGVVVLLIEPVS